MKNARWVRLADDLTRGIPRFVFANRDGAL